MLFDFDEVFNKKPYPKHLASNSPCKKCPFGSEDELFFIHSYECEKCGKYVTWAVDCILKLAEMEEKYEVDLK